MIQNLPEYVPAEENSKDDMQKVTDILNLLGTTAHISAINRLGKPNPEQPRTLKVTISTVAEKKAILAKAKNLRDKSMPLEVQEVYIRPDLTPRQQAASKNLRAELKEIRDRRPDQKWTIRHNKIVQQEPKPAGQ